MLALCTSAMALLPCGVVLLLMKNTSYPRSVLPVCLRKLGRCLVMHLEVTKRGASPYSFEELARLEDARASTWGTYSDADSVAINIYTSIHPLFYVIFREEASDSQDIYYCTTTQY